jgi:hypothetical protein
VGERRRSARGVEPPDSVQPGPRWPTLERRLSPRTDQSIAFGTYRSAGPLARCAQITGCVLPLQDVAAELAGAAGNAATSGAATSAAIARMRGGRRALPDTVRIGVLADFIGSPLSSFRYFGTNNATIMTCSASRANDMWSGRQGVTTAQSPPRATRPRCPHPTAAPFRVGVQDRADVDRRTAAESEPRSPSRSIL